MIKRLSKSVLLALSAMLACDDPVGVDKVLRMGVIEVAGHGPDLAVPSSVEAPGTIDITLSTFGDSCVEPGEVEQEWGEGTLTIRPNDWDFPPDTNTGEPCLDLIKVMTRRLQISVPAFRSGSTVVVKLVGATIPEGDTIVESRVLQLR